MICSYIRSYSLLWGGFFSEISPEGWSLNAMLPWDTMRGGALNSELENYVAEFALPEFQLALKVVKQAAWQQTCELLTKMWNYDETMWNWLHFWVVLSYSFLFETFGVKSYHPFEVPLKYFRWRNRPQGAGRHQRWFRLHGAQWTFSCFLRLAWQVPKGDGSEDDFMMPNLPNSSQATKTLWIMFTAINLFII